VSETLAELQAQIETVAAERAELLLQIRRHELIEVAKLEPLIIERAHGVRDLLLYGPVRHAAPLAAAHRLNPEVVLTTLTSLMRRVLTEISKSPRA